jgi:hypothetical protein
MAPQRRFAFNVVNHDDRYKKWQKYEKEPAIASQRFLGHFGHVSLLRAPFSAQ